MPAAPEAIRDVLVDVEDYPTWWPQIVAVASLGPDDSRVRCRSTLPYTLDLVIHAVSRDLPTLEVGIEGHLTGYARWTLTPVPSPQGEWTRMEYEQRVDVRGLLGLASYVGRPLLRWNHRRMMVGCRLGLERRLAAELRA